VPLGLQVAHPVHRLLDVAAGRQHELVEQAHEVEAGEDRLDQRGVEVQVLMTHEAPS
jgi:hypothetical protein